jgi:IS30 family transposase
MRTFHHLTTEERYHIYIENKKGKSLSDIAKDISKHKSTISRELARNTGQRGYRHKQAHSMALQRHLDKPKATKMNEAMKQVITPWIEEKWSPEQISGRVMFLICCFDK